MSDTLVDPRVSRAKFQREVTHFRQFEQDYILRGWWILRAEFPEVWINFAKTVAPFPPIVVFGARLNFTNYDFWPPSVRIVHPFTGVPFRYNELPSQLLRRMNSPGKAQDRPTEADNTQPTQLAVGAEQQQAPYQAIMQPDEIPFMCLPGVREYHDHPAHTGDSWFLHRSTGVGSLNYILEQIHKYGVQPMQIQMQYQVMFLANAAKVPP